MIFKIATPLSNCANAAGTGVQGDYVYPMPGAAGVGSRVFLVCDVKGQQQTDELACRGVYHAVCDAVSAGHDASKPFQEETFHDALHVASDVLDSIDGVGDDEARRVRRGDVALAFAALHRGGCFLATTGCAQVMLVRPGHGIVYRSRNVDERARLGDEQQMHHIDAVSRNITDVQPGDYIYLSNDKGGIMADDEIVELLADGTLADAEKLERLRLATVEGDTRREYLIHITDVQADAESMVPVLESRFKVGKVVRGPLVVAVVTALLALWFMVVFAISSYIIDRFDL